MKIEEMTNEELLLAFLSESTGDSWENGAEIELLSRLERFERALELIDGCEDIVESFKAESPAQEEWRYKWLRDARRLLKEVRNE